MDLLQVLILALVQGLTEFLPISSSGHLVLVPRWLGWEDQGLAFDVAVHLGTLFAVVAYFRQDILQMARAWLSSFDRAPLTHDAQLGWSVLLATVPAGIAGLIFSDAIETHLRSPQVIAVTTVVFGILLWAADVLGRRERPMTSLGWRDAFLIGCAQALALIPGTSRSGITITMALALGLDRNAAARFSFLLAIPIITLASGLQIVQLSHATGAVDWLALGVGTVAAAVCAYACIHWFLRFVSHAGMAVFAIYRLLLGVAIWWSFA